MEEVFEIPTTANGEYQFKCEAALYLHRDQLVLITYADDFVPRAATYYGKFLEGKKRTLEGSFNDRKNLHIESGTMNSTEQMTPFLQGSKRDVEFLELLCQVSCKSLLLWFY
jgi:hypothetical protein